MNNDIRKKMIHFLVEYEKNKLCNDAPGSICKPYCKDCEYNSLDYSELSDLAYEIIMEVMRNGYIQR